MKRNIFVLILVSPILILSQQWALIGLEKERVNAIAVDPVNNSIVYAGSMSSFSDGIYGKLFKSTDAGITWDTLLYNVSVQEISILPQKTSFIYVALASTNFTRPGILKSTNSGESWTWADSGLTLNYEISVATIDPHPDSLGVAFAGTVGFYGGNVYKTVDGGRYWKQYSADVMCCQFEDIFFDPIDHSTIYVGSGRLYRSTDSGLRWNVLNDWTPVSGEVKLAIDSKNNNILYAGLPGYRLLKSSDRGENWFFADSGIVRNNYWDILISPINNKHIFTVTSGGVFQSKNSAISWESVNEGFPPNTYFRKLLISTIGSKLYCGTDRGLYKLDLLTSVGQLNHSLSKKITLHQNYPNPFNPSTKIEYSLSGEKQNVKVSVYNVMGQEVVVLVNKVHGAGNYEVTFDGSDYPSGLYLIKIISGSYSKTIKSLLIK
jgi:photosystem II stability/assembly factor-like uncharacterized protein